MTSALVSELFEEKLDGKALDLHKEDRSMTVDMKDRGKTQFRTLSPSECSLELAVDFKRGTYSLSGSLNVKNIPSTSQNAMTMVKAPVDHRAKDSGTRSLRIDQSIDVRGNVESMPRGESPGDPRT